MAMNMGGDDFISKPFEINVLIAKIVLGQRRMKGGYDLSQSKGALKGTMGRCEFTDKSLALSNA